MKKVTFFGKEHEDRKAKKRKRKKPWQSDAGKMHGALAHERFMLSSLPPRDRE